MSLILVLLEIPSAVENGIAFPGISTFAVKARLSSDSVVRQAIAITDGVASDRFVTYGNTLAGREGAKKRKTLVEFLRTRQARGSRLFLKLLAPRGQLGLVLFNLRAAEQCTLGQLRRKLRFFQPGDLIEVVATEGQSKGASVD